MASAALKQSIPFSQFEQLRAAREIILQEAEALSSLAGRLDTRFCEAVDLLLECPGRVIVSGIGKAGLIGQKIVATLSSTGTPAQFLHPSEAVHGDLGCVSECDVVLVLSNSGETEEISRLTPLVRQLGAKIVALTNGPNNSLAKAADVVLEIGRLREAGELALAPSTTTTAMLAMGDALALVVSQQRGFTARDFSVFHPGGSLGRRLTPVQEVMRRGEDLRIAQQGDSIRATLQRLRKTGRRSGALLVLDDEGCLIGLFTDSDLARLLEQHRDEQLDRPLAEVMTRGPLTIRETASLDDAVALLTDRKISELPVVDGDGCPIGLIDITDVIGLCPNAAG
ncbi:KpsF/GutQ family sugar-phosphate isomerase [bacterium]|nr:KpsF/GutQ family sugar-phosphate isomerase [bacterium]